MKQTGLENIVGSAPLKTYQSVQPFCYYAQTDQKKPEAEDKGCGMFPWLLFGFAVYYLLFRQDDPADD